MIYTKSTLVLDKAVDSYSNSDKIVLAGDFNAKKKEGCAETSHYQHDIKVLVNKVFFKKFMQNLPQLTYF